MMSYPEFMGVFTVVFTGFYIYFNSLLNEEESIDELVQKLKKYRYLEFYQIRLKKTLLNLDNSLGELSWGRKFISDNIMFHFGLSILYIFFIYYFLWLINGEEVLSTMNIFESNTSIYDRILISFELLVVFFVVYFFEKRKKEHTTLDLYSKLFSLLGGTIGIGLVVLAKQMQEVAGLLIAIILVVILAYVFSYQRTFIKRITTIGSFGTFSIVSFLILGTVNYFYNNSFFNQITISMYFFLLMLPMLNAQLDFLSLSISRYFSTKIANDNNIIFILIHLLLDILVAAILLLVLVDFLYNSIELINGYIDTHIPIKEMLINTIQNPLSTDNIWVTSMLISTLIPTFVHFLLAIIVFVLYLSKVSSWYIFQIENIKDVRKDKKIKITAFLALPSTFLSLILSYICLYLPYKYLIKWIGI